MADVSKVKINNTEYDIKDANALPKSGGTMTGNLVIQKADYTGFYGKRSDVTIGTTPASDKGVSYWAGLDSNGAMISYAESFLDDNGDNVLYFQANNRDSGNNLISTAFSIRANTNGTRSVAFSHPELWRNALELSDSGWQSLTDNTKFTGTILYRKIGKQVQVVTSDAIQLASDLSTMSIGLATIPTGYRPHAIVSSYAGNIYSYAAATIDTYGGLLFYKPNAVSTWTTAYNIRFNFTYFID